MSVTIQTVDIAASRHHRMQSRPYWDIKQTWDIAELPLVMAEIADAMAARGTTLTLHADDGRKTHLLHASRYAPVDHPMVDALLDREMPKLGQHHDDSHAWVSYEIDDFPCHMLVIAVERVPGHSRLVISAFFDAMDEERRSEVEEVYLRRRPFAIGYFRLWQLERIHQRRISALQSALHLMEVGVMLLDKDGTLVFCNDAAAQILELEDGLRRHHNTLRATNLREGARLQLAIDHVIGSSGPDGVSVRERRAPIMAIKRENGPPLILSVLPTIEPPTEPSDVAAIIYLLDPAIDTTQLLQPVCKLYKLSPVETKLVCQLAGGATMAQAAEAMHVKEQTARSCLKQVFLKTNTNRQADLVRVMLSNLVRTTRDFQSEVI